MSAGLRAPLAVRGVCLDAGGRVLLCRSWRREWELPGGAPRLGGELTACLVREVRDKTGLEIEIRVLLTAWELPDAAGAAATVVAYGCEPRSGETPRSSGEHSIVAYRRLADLPRHRLAPADRQAVRMWQERRLAG